MDKKDYKLFASLTLWALVPSIYLLFRMNIVSINKVSIDILGQMEWFDLIDETIVTTLTVPLYFLLKPEKSSSRKNGLAFLISFGIYILFTFAIALKVGTIADFMNASYAAQYLFLQSFSLLIAYISAFMILLFTLNQDHRTVCALLICKVAMLYLFDFLMISRFKDIGASYSEIIVNSIVAITALVLALRRKYISFGKCEVSWIKDWGRIGAFSGVQILLDNIFYAIMICKMVNAVASSGNYWVANNFIWGWLLIPVMSLGEIIKKNNLEKLTIKNTWQYAIAIGILWLITMPFWRWFIAGPMASDAPTILSIVLPSIPFYFAFIASACIDAWFVSRGKTIYLMIISILVNIGYYGTLFILFKNGFFTMNMNFIIMMFGFGLAFHLLASILLYLWEHHKCPADL
ncbi:MAG: hypothetical protein J6V90_07500 [Treponema sp.]|nr:hypothetical protein [Treponema sp.]